MNSTLSGFLYGTANVFDAIDAFMIDNTIDVMYKALAFCAGLMTLYFIPFTRQFAIWVALAVLLLLMLQSSPTDNVSSAPATSTLPMPTQINTPDPSQGAPGGASGAQSASGGGSGLLGTAEGLAGLILPIFGL